jgi:hypothetical protein
MLIAIKDDAIHVCCSFSILAVRTKDTTRCIASKGNVRKDNVYHISEDLNSLDGETKINVYASPILHAPSANMNFPAEHQVASNIDTHGTC